jgi:hypothetical protein
VTAPVPRGDKLRLAVDAFRKLKGKVPDWELLHFHGTLTWEADRDLIGKLQAANLIECDLNGALPGQAIPVTLEFDELRTERAYFARTLKQLLSDRLESRYNGPECFFLAEEAKAGYLHPDEATEQPAVVTNYLSALRVVRLLTDVANTSDDRTLVRKIFMTWSRHSADSTAEAASRDMTIEICYDADDLVPIDQEQLDQLERLMTTDKYQEQTRQIFMNAVCGHVANTTRDFPALLAGFDAVYRKFDDDYNLFMSQFSFEKVLQETEALKLDFTAKLNEVFASIQNKLLAVPLAVVVVASQMKNEADATLENVIILLGAAVFAALMALLVANQWDTLEVLHNEIARERCKVKEHPAFEKKLGPIYEELDGRYRRQRFLLTTVLVVLVAFAVLLPMAVFFSYEFG